MGYFRQCNVLYFWNHTYPSLHGFLYNTFHQSCCSCFVTLLMLLHPLLHQSPNERHTHTHTIRHSFFFCHHSLSLPISFPPFYLLMTTQYPSSMIRLNKILNIHPTSITVITTIIITILPSQEGITSSISILICTIFIFWHSPHLDPINSFIGRTALIGHIGCPLFGLTGIPS